MVKWSDANAKTKALAKVPALIPFLQNKRKIFSVDLLSGHSCPFAMECFSRVDIIGGKKKIVDGKDTKFRCFSASQEVVYPHVYTSRKSNYDIFRACKTTDDMVKLLDDTMPQNLGICRIHVGGDFFNPKYFLAWLYMAQNHPDRLFYAYTKSLPYWVKHRKLVDKISNFVLTASYGGRYDHLIKQERLRYARVLDTMAKLSKNKLEIDDDDSHAADPSKKRKNFALLIHNTQPAGSEASEVLQYQRKNNIKHSYK